MKTITAAAVIAYLGAVCATDSPEWQPSDLPAQLAVCAASGLWLVLFGAANNWFCEKREEKHIMTKEKAIWAGFCKKAAPLVDDLRKLAAEFGITDGRILSISILDNDYANMSVKKDNIFYECGARGEEEYVLSTLGEDPDSFESLLPFGTISRTQNGGETNETQNDPERQEGKPWRNETNITQGRISR